MWGDGLGLLGLKAGETASGDISPFIWGRGSDLLILPPLPFTL